MLLEDGKQRFVDLAKNPQVSDRVLVERLKELEREEIVCKEDNLYCLTPRGSHLKKYDECEALGRNLGQRRRMQLISGK